MTHKDIFKIFQSVLPIYAEKTTEYFSNGKNSIRIRLGEIHQDFIFTFNSNKEWRFETVDNFIKTLTKKNK